MASPRCVQCGRLVAAGFLCDACQFAQTSAIRPPQGDVFVAQDPIRRYNLPAIAAAGFVLAVGCIIFLELPKIEQALTQPAAGPSAPVADASNYTEVGRPSTSSGFQAGSAVPNNPPPAQMPPAASPQQPESKTGAPSSAPMKVTVGTIASAASVDQTFESSAEKDLPKFLDAYCKERVTKVHLSVQVTKVTWLAGGIGAFVEVKEGWSTRQGSAQYTAQNGWKWMIRPEQKYTGS